MNANHSLTARWRSLDGEGLDHVTVEVAQDRLIARGAAIGARGGAPYGVYYRIDMPRGWGVRELAIGTADGRGLHLLTDGQGHWATGNGEPLPALTGCVDVDLAGTAFTNTLPIRRLDWAAGQSRELKMAYVPFDSFEPIVDGQVYTCLEPGRRFLYQAADRSFQAELSVDADGLVTDYPSLFSRVL
ncbi:putative glycolipid-binding domain-containing protein [Chelatococcus sambhunathii]|uniref:Glycolipid-binding domain-containing protein n=1 Tax=Chelatococcus sambhunathii TaxID=363953 RepID=A0ABU1DJ87_9HYPH|nr:putative glycolipid-binding domain-containing protein [Chelatococcus sambhunathii]MDR4308154.1 putative glycolipid-binding domain-containing protein [Chelatococcus sambhunathii]